LFHINEGARAKLFDVLPDALMKRGLRIAVPKSRPDHEEIIAAFDAAVAEMRADGTYDALLASFRVSTW
jgi:polar amino acid transport system substrate-binding protein